MSCSPLKRLLLIVALICLLAGCAYGKHIDAGDELFAKGQYEQALVEYQAAVKLNPDSEEARGKVADTRRRIGARYEEEARALLKQEDYVGAISAASRAQEHAEVAPSVLQLARDVSTRSQQRADDLAAQRQWAPALQIVDALYEAFPDDRAVLDERLVAFRAAWAADLTARAQKAEAAKHHGDALLLYAQAAELTQGPVHIAKRDELLAMLVDTQSYNLVVVPDDSSRGARVIAASLGRASDQRLVRIIDSKLAKKGKTAHLTLSIDAGSPEFDTRRDLSTRVARYKSGTRQVPNPFYQNAQDDVLRAEREAQRYQEEIYRLESDLANYQSQVAREGATPNTSTGAEQGVSRTQSSLEYARNNYLRAQDVVQREREELARTAQTVEEDVYSDLQYTVTTHHLDGRAEIVLRLTHADGRPPIEINRFATVTASDEEHAPQPLANVSGDPLQLPSRDSLSSTLWSVGASYAVNAIVQSLDAHRANLLDLAFKAGDEGERMHYFVLYILLDPTSVDPKIVQEIEQSRGIPNSPQLLSGR
jgi:tetratricopeptide (TPR) repeat protein